MKVLKRIEVKRTEMLSVYVKEKYSWKEVELYVKDDREYPYFCHNEKWYHLLSANEAREYPDYGIKGKCEGCQVVSHFFKVSGCTLKDYFCLRCKGPVTRTSRLLKGFEELFEEYK